jgi:hypothetical protein
MIAATLVRTETFCILDDYTSAWELGSGEVVILEPGEYRITSRSLMNGHEYVQLDEEVEIFAKQVKRTSVRTKSIPLPPSLRMGAVKNFKKRESAIESGMKSDFGTGSEFGTSSPLACPLVWDAKNSEWPVGQDCYPKWSSDATASLTSHHNTRGRRRICDSA